MPRDLSKYLSTIQWESISTPDEAIELWLIANADRPSQCQLSCVYLSVKLRTPQFTTGDLRQAVADMKRIGSIMEAQAPGDEGPYEYLVYTGGAWDHRPEDALPVTMAEPEPTPVPTPTPPQAYVVMHGNPATGFTIHGTWASACDAQDWADRNVYEYDYWLMPLVHAYP